MSHHAAFTFGALSCIGGTVAFIRKGSKASLIGGGGCGSLLLASGYLIQQNMNGGHELAAATSALMFAAMSVRAYKTGARVPIIIAALSGVSMAYYSKKVVDFM